MPTTKQRMAKVAAPKQRTQPVWAGPESDAPNGGVTYSLLSRFLCCRERFRLMVVEGLRAADTFSSRLEFGNMWHLCEEKHAEVVKEQKETGEVKVGYLPPLREYCAQLCRRYPLDQDKVQHWFSVTQALFPVYVHHWSQSKHQLERTPLLQEQVFAVPYKLPSGRVVHLRGKWDGVSLIGKGKAAGVYLDEHKTKSSIDGTKIARQLSFDLQTMTYLVSLDWYNEHDGDGKGLPAPQFRLGAPIRGVYYNCVRRSAHKTVGSMLEKLEKDRRDGRMDEWFGRWRVEVTPADVAKFRRECLDPILEQLCIWWQHVVDAGQDPWSYHGHEPYDWCIHWRHPYGIYNPMDEGGFSDVDAYLESGSEVGLQMVDELFPELK